MTSTVAEIKMIGTEHVAYYHGKEVSRGKNPVKVAEKLYKYMKGQADG